jgi:hypothetical protein
MSDTTPAPHENPTSGAVQDLAPTEDEAGQVTGGERPPHATDTNR